MKTVGLVAVTIAVFCTAGVDVHGQAIDYGALEKLFGEPVSTSVTGSPKRASDAPATMEIITADDIRRSGALDIPGVLRHVPGVDVQQWTNNQTDIGVRGYNQANSQRVLVLINGRQAFADYFSVPWSALAVELADIRQIELVKGPNSALFGFNAVGGVINIITYDPAADMVQTLSFAGGTQHLLQASGGTTVRWGQKGAFRLSGSARTNRDFSTPLPENFVGTDRLDNNRKAIALDGVVQLADHVRVRVEARHADTDQNGINSAYFGEFTRLVTSSATGELAADTRVGLLRATAYSHWIKSDGQSFNPLVFANHVWVAKAENIFKAGTNHTVLGAVEYRHDSAPTNPITGGVVSYAVVSASGMWEWKIKPSVTLTEAVRLDRLALDRNGSLPAGAPFSNADWDRVINEVSFNSGLRWKVDDADVFRLTVSRGALLPNLIDFGAFYLETPDVVIPGNPFLEPTVVTNYEAAWDRTWPALQTRLRTAVFYQRSSDLIAHVGGVIPAADALYSTPTNVGRSEAAGVSVAISGTLRNSVRWGIAYRGERVTDHLDPGAQGGITYIEYAETTPDHLFNANLGWSHGSWEMDGYLRAQSRTAGLLLILEAGTGSLTSIDGYASVDGRLAYRLTPRATISLSGQNLTQSHQRQTSGPDVERRVTAGFDYRF